MSSSAKLGERARMAAIHSASPHACQAARENRIAIGNDDTVPTLCLLRVARHTGSGRDPLRSPEKRDRVAAGMDRPRPSVQSRNLEANGIR